MSRTALKSTLILGALAVSLWAAPFWASKPYTQWTEKEVEKILGDSPWMQTAEVTFDMEAMRAARARMGGGDGAPGGGMGGPGGGGMGGPGGGMGGPGGGPGGMGGGMSRPEVYVMWQSSTPIRQAMARAASLKSSPTAESLEQQLKETPTHHVLAVMGLPAGPGGQRGRGPGGPDGQAPPSGGPEGAAQGRGGRGPGGQAPSPERMAEMRERMQQQMKENSFLVIDGQKISPEKVETVFSGSERILMFYFPKTVEITSKTKSAAFEGSMGPLKIEAKFKPKDMLF